MSEAETPAVGDGKADETTQTNDPETNGLTSWSDVLLALIPGEVTAVYLGIRSTVAIIGETAEDIGVYVPFVLLISIVLLTLLTPVIAMKLRSTSSRIGYFVALSFLVWSLNIDYNRMLELVYLLEKPILTAVASYAIPISMIIWAGLAVPVFAKMYGEPENGKN